MQDSQTPPSTTEPKSPSPASSLPPELWHLIMLHLSPQDIWLSLRPATRQLHSLSTRHFAVAVLPRLQLRHAMSLSGSAHHRWYDLRATLHFRYAADLGESCRVGSDDDDGRVRFVLEKVEPARHEQRAMQNWAVWREEMTVSPLSLPVPSCSSSPAEEKTAVAGQASIVSGSTADLPAPINKVRIFWRLGLESESGMAMPMSLPGPSAWVDAEGREMVAFLWKEAMGLWCRLRRQRGSPKTLSSLRAQLSSDTS